MEKNEKRTACASAEASSCAKTGAKCEPLSEKEAKVGLDNGEKGRESVNVVAKCEPSSEKEAKVGLDSGEKGHESANVVAKCEPLSEKVAKVGLDSGEKGRESANVVAECESLSEKEAKVGLACEEKERESAEAAAKRSFADSNNSSRKEKEEELMAQMRTCELFSSGHSIADGWIFRHEYPWDMLGEIKSAVEAIGAALDKNEYREISPSVWVAYSARVDESAKILPPTIIDANAEIRHGAFIRGSVIVGKGAVVGNSTELKNSIIFDGVQVPHYNYVGDSLLGYFSHLGAGAITSNVKSDKSSVGVRYGCASEKCGGDSSEGFCTKFDTGRRKCGAMLGDFVEVGCNSVLCPGSVIGRESIVYPLSRVRGFVPGGSIYKAEGCVVKREGERLSES